MLNDKSVCVITFDSEHHYHLLLRYHIAFDPVNYSEVVVLWNDIA